MLKRGDGDVGVGDVLGVLSLPLYPSGKKQWK